MLKRKRIDILVSSSEDVQKERSITEQSIRRVAAEFDVPVSASYCYGLRRSKPNETRRTGRDNGEDGLLCPYFLEHQDARDDLEQSEHILNPGQYDLVIKILWSRLGASLASMAVMPDGSQPGSASEYEIAWALYQSKQTPGFPGLQVYRNRATPAALLEPKEKRENLCRQWDAVQEFCAAWEYGETRFRDCCHEYQDLEEFENLFTEHFRDFLHSRIEPRSARYLESNPYRGLQFFDFEDADLFHGRTRAIWEVIDALKNQATAKKRFLLVLGHEGSGKSSLIRAGVLPLLTQGGTPVGNGPWRRAVTRPLSGGVSEDPLDTLAAALLSRCALPELQEEESTVEWHNLASRLSKNPGAAAARIAELLDQLARPESDHSETEEIPEKRNERIEVAGKRSLVRIKPKAQLVVFVDQFEDLFAGRFSPSVQQTYISALSALAKCEGIFVIATLESRFYPHCGQFPELIEALTGKYELQPPTPRGFGNIIRFPAEAVGLRFERDPATNRCLDEALVEAAIARPKPLPLLEHVLSRLYQRQLDRKDGLLRWSDYSELGELRGALALHEKTVFSKLKPEEKQALKPVIRQLVVPGRGEEAPFIRRTVLYSDLFSSPRLNHDEKAGAKGLVDRLVKEGLLRADAGPKDELLISVAQEALLRRWPGVWQWLSEDRHFFQMRDHLDASLKLWLERDRHKDDLLDPGIGLAEAQTLLRDFESSLSKGQTEYIEKSLARQKRRSRIRDNLGLAALAGFAVFAAYAGVERFRTERRSTNSEQEVQRIQQNGDLANSQQSALETQLKKAEQEKAQLVKQNADLVNNQSVLETQLKKAEEKAQLAQQNADLTKNQSALATELKKAQDDKAQLAKRNTDLANNQSALDTELKKAQDDKAQLAKQSTDLTNNQSVLDAALKKAQDEKTQLAKQNADLTNNQSPLDAALKKAQDDKAQLVKQNADLASNQSALESQLKKTQDEKAQLAKQNADLTNSQSPLITQLKNAQDKAQIAQQNADIATSQQSALEAELKKAEEKAQIAQQNTDHAGSQRNALDTELKKVQDEKTQLAKQNADLTNNQSTLDAALKKAQDDKAQLVKQNADLASNQSALETQLKKTQDEKAQLANQNAIVQNPDLPAGQQNGPEAQPENAEEQVQPAQQHADLSTHKHKPRENRSHAARKTRESRSKKLALKNRTRKRPTSTSSILPSQWRAQTGN